MEETTAPYLAFSQESPSNHAARILVISYIFLSIAILLMTIRLAWRWKIQKKVSIDDWFIIAATGLAMGATIAITVACNTGLGQHQDTVADAQYEHYAKSYYAAQILTVGSLGLAKMSLISTVVSFRPHRDILIGCHVLELVVALWTIASIFAIAFQCDLPQPWHSSVATCVDQTGLYSAVGAFNIATDIGIVMLPVVIMPRIQISTKDRLVVQVLFAFRLLVPVLTVLNLVSLSRAYSHSVADLSWAIVTPTTYSQVMPNLSLVTATIPSVRKVATLQTGVYGAQVSEDFGFSASGSRGHTTDTHNQSGNGRKKTFGRGNFNPSYPNRTVIERSDSMRSLKDNIIMHTIDFKVEREDDNAPYSDADRRHRSRDENSNSQSTTERDRDVDGISVLEVRR